MKWLVNVCLVMLLAVVSACVGSPSPGELPPFVKSAITVARGVGDAVLRAKGADELRRKVPELVPLIDRPTIDEAGNVTAPPDGMLTLREVEAFLVAAATDPESVALLVATLALLR
jgi:hypothetical protein